MKKEFFDINKLFLIRKVYDKYMSNKTVNEAFTSGYVIFAEALKTKDFYSQQELTEFLGCNKAHTSRTLLKMQMKGLVKPVCYHSDKPIELTEKGKQFAHEAIEAKKKLVAQLTENIDEKDLEQFFKILGKIISNAESLSAN